MDLKPERLEGERPHRVIAIAASAGGLEALRHIVGTLAADLPAALCVVLHIPPVGRSMLAPILNRTGPFTAVVAESGMRLRAGTIYVAPADHHLLVRGEGLEVTRGPKENCVRPSADPLFRSLAASWGPDAVAVVLSGALADGAAGVVAVARAGGTVIVQDPADAVVAGMPSNAIAATAPDHIAPLTAIPAVLDEVVRGLGIGGREAGRELATG